WQGPTKRSQRRSARRSACSQCGGSSGGWVGSAILGKGMGLGMERRDQSTGELAEAAVAADPARRPRSLLDLEGLGAELWDGVDAQEYGDQPGMEWDRPEVET